MTTKQAIALLKSDVKAWNTYRAKHPGYRPGLAGSDLSGADLAGADLARSDLIAALLTNARLEAAHLSESYLADADLSGADLRGADLHMAKLYEADLKGACLTGAFLSGADFCGADLSGACLRGVDLSSVDLSWAHLGTADLTNAVLFETVLGSTDLSGAKGLDSCKHDGPSTIDHRTLIKSGNLPPQFLRGCGLPDSLIEHLPSLFDQLDEFCSCFISHSTKDQAIADRLRADLVAKGVRCWLATEDLKIGDPFRDRIDQAIRRHDKLLVILSETSVASTWVADEVETAFEEERKRKRAVLFPIRLDGAVMDAKAAWAVKIRQRHIGDFRRWKNRAAYQKAFNRLLRDLRAEPSPDAADASA